MSKYLALKQWAMEIAARCVSADGELDKENELQFDRQKMELAEYIDKMAVKIEVMDFLADYWKEEGARISKLSKSYENESKSSSDRIKYEMATAGDTDAEGNLYRFKLSDSKPKVEIFDESLLPAKFVREKVTHEPDKTLISEALSKGEEVPGCRLIQGHTLRKYLNVKK